MRLGLAGWRVIAVVLSSCAVLCSPSRSLPPALMNLVQSGCHATRNLMIDIWSLRGAERSNSSSWVTSCNSLNLSWQLRRSNGICRRLSLRFSDSSSSVENKFALAQAHAVLHAALIASEAFPLVQQRQLQTLNRDQLLEHGDACFRWAKQSTLEAGLQDDLDTEMDKRREHVGLSETRDNIFAKLSDICQETFGAISLQVAGSVGCGLSDVTSDMDVVLHVNRPMAPNETHTIAKSLTKALQQDGHLSAFSVLNTRVPVVKFRCNQPAAARPLAGDISINNDLALRHAALVRRYARAEPRLDKVVRAVKLWAAQRRVVGARDAGVTSFGLLVMTLFVLERAGPRLLPDIIASEGTDGARPALPAAAMAGANGAARDPAPTTRAPRLRGAEVGGADDTAAGTEDWMELLARFFWCYGVEVSDFAGVAISARCGRLLPRARWREAVEVAAPQHESTRERSSQRKAAAMFVEDPLLPDSNLARHVTNDTALALQLEMARAYTLIRSGAPLSSLMAPLPAPERLRRRRR